MKFVLFVSITILCFAWPLQAAAADQWVDLCEQVAKLDIQCGGYILGRVLTNAQQENARRNAIAPSSPGTYKFKDKALYVVADQTTHRVIIMYESYPSASRQKMQAVVGTLFFNYGDPTVMAHARIIYWAFDERGKIGEERYRRAKQNQRHLSVLATIKLTSGRRIMETGPGDKDANLDYIVSSEQILKLLPTLHE
jgi:hypothetical protein